MMNMSANHSPHHQPADGNDSSAVSPFFQPFNQDDVNSLQARPELYNNTLSLAYPGLHQDSLSTVLRQESLSAIFSPTQDPFNGSLHQSQFGADVDINMDMSQGLQPSFVVMEDCSTQSSSYYPYSSSSNMMTSDFILPSQTSIQSIPPPLLSADIFSSAFPTPSQQQQQQQHQQHPALTLQVPNFATPFDSLDNNSSVPMLTTDLSQQPPHLRSPIIHLQSYDELPNTTPQKTEGHLSPTYSHSKNSRLSPIHLFPLNDDRSEDGMLSHYSSNASITAFPSLASTPSRNGDGSWVRASGNAPAGLSPIERQLLNDIEMPRITELERLRHLCDKNATVEDWLIPDPEGGSPDDFLSVRDRPSINRPRAKSANNVASRLTANSHQPSPGFLDVPPPPGPGIFVQESSDCGDEDDIDNTFPLEAFSQDAKFSDNIQEQPVDISALVGYPWTDDPPPIIDINKNGRHQPSTSNAAISAFQAKSRDSDADSLAATLGSCRRGSLTDLDSLAGAAEFARSNSNLANQDPPTKPKRGFFSMISNKLPTRANSRKRRADTNSIINAIPEQTYDSSSPPPPPPPPPAPHKPKLKPHIPKLMTNVSAISGGAGRSPHHFGKTLSATVSLFRNRSKSDCGRSSKSPPLTELLARQGGPPALSLPTLKHFKNVPLGIEDEGESDDDNNNQDHALQNGVTMNLNPILNLASLPIPNLIGFKIHILSLNPRIEETLLARLTEEQCRRYKRLFEARKKHIKLVEARNCTALCPLLGGQPLLSKHLDNCCTFRVVPLDQMENYGERNIGVGERLESAAQFPPGIPHPQTHVFPSRFECQLCFQNKEVKKPSDWTRHVHEDIQPFTCTFADCRDPKSFKRKADWVRHETERHWQLDSWNCDAEGCNHVCYRRDNFVQHMIREHKMPEPKLRVSKVGVRSQHLASSFRGDFPLDYDFDKDTPEAYCQRTVNRCFVPSTRSASDSPCPFCGNKLISWKKLQVHVGKHMEQITLPLIPLLDRVVSNELVPKILTTLPFSASPTSAEMVTSNFFTTSPENEQSFYFPDHEPLADGTEMFLNIQQQQPQRNGGFLSPITGASFPPAATGSPRSRAGSNAGSDYGFHSQSHSRPTASYPSTNLPLLGDFTFSGLNDVNDGEFLHEMNYGTS